jgi:diguanylate cyclase (GGDEF)-like protein
MVGVMTNSLRALLRSSNFAALPIIAVVTVSTALAAGLGWITLKQADDFAIDRQGDVLIHALAAHAEQIGRQGIPQVFWQEAAEKVRARDVKWMDENYGPYLYDVFGYRQSYILDGMNRPIYAAVDGIQTSPTRYRTLAPIVSRRVKEVREGPSGVDKTGFISEVKQYADGSTQHLIVSANAASVDGRPSLVTISTIIPDLDPAGLGNELPYLLVAVADIDDGVLSRIARDYGFSGLRWGDDRNDGRAVRTLTDDQGRPISGLSWIPERPAAAFVERLKPALALSFLVLAFASGAAMRAARSLARARTSVAELGHDARHDALTGLANRRLFTEELTAAFDRYRHGGPAIALLSVDLDKFKELNDGAGHLAGDEALQQVAGRIREVVGRGGSIARVGGDEFQVILENRSPDEVQTIASRIIERVSYPMDLARSIEWRLGCSIGIAFSDGGDVDDLMRRADLAMSTAKARGRNRLEHFEEAMDDRLKERISMERALRSALQHEYLSVDYQPILQVQSEKIVGAEALVRWRHPLVGFVSPDRFLPVAESTGLVSVIDQFVLARACEHATGWPDITVSVNVSAQRMLSTDVVDRVRSTLEMTGLAAERLELEITEGGLIEDEDRAASTISALRDLGVGIALDDVGIGYSSLSLLRRLPFTRLKIDRSLTSDIGLKTDANEIIFSLIRIGKALQMSVTAEGVETLAQKQFLEAAGCDALQGFLFSKPLSANNFLKMLENAAEDRYPSPVDRNPLHHGEPAKLTQVRRPGL